MAQHFRLHSLSDMSYRLPVLAIASLAAGLSLVLGSGPAIAGTHATPLAEHKQAARSTADVVRKASSSAKQETHYACEKYLVFVNPKDKLAGDFMHEDNDMVAWTPAYKAQLDKAFVLVVQKAPGLVARACNGERIPILLSNDERAAMESNAARIMVFTWCFQDGTHDVAETLAHEMTHLVDIGTGLSWGREWNQLIVGRVNDYRKKFPNPEALDDPQIERKASAERHRLGFPTDYTAENPTEALAEYTAAIAVSGFKAPPEIDKFVREEVLSMPTSSNPATAFIREGYKEQTRGETDKALASFTQALRLDPTSPVAHWFLGSVWEEKHEPELVMHELRTAATILSRNGVPSYCPDMEAVVSQIRSMNMQQPSRR